MAQQEKPSVIEIYQAHAATLRARYDSVDTGDVLVPVIDLLPPATDLLDVGAGSGRDAAWFAARGHRVTAAEPVVEFRAAIALRAPAVRVVDAQLPALDGVCGRFGVILVGALWHHLESAAREAAFMRIAGLLAPAGLLLLSLRHGPVPPGMPIHALDPKDETARAEAAGLRLLRCVSGLSHQQENIAAGVHWTWLALGKGQENAQ